MNKKTILVVDDDDSVRELITDYIENIGLSVIAAQDANEAFMAWQENHEKIDLILTDILMPGKTGIDLYYEVTEQKPNARFIFISGDPGGMKIPSRAVFCQKPIALSQLFQKINSVIDL